MRLSDMSTMFLKNDKGRKNIKALTM